MSCDTNRKKLWKAIGLNDKKMDSIFLSAKRKAQKTKASKETRADWLEKTKRILAIFDYYEIDRPVHSITGIPRLSSLAGFAAIADALETIEVPLFGSDTGGLSKDEMIDGLTKLGQKAILQSTTIKLLAVGGVPGT